MNNIIPILDEIDEDSIPLATNPMVASEFSEKVPCTNRRTRHDLPTPASCNDDHTDIDGMCMATNGGKTGV